MDLYVLLKLHIIPNPNGWKIDVIPGGKKANEFLSYIIIYFSYGEELLSNTNTIF